MIMNARFRDGAKVSTMTLVISARHGQGWYRRVPGFPRSDQGVFANRAEATAALERWAELVRKADEAG